MTSGKPLKKYDIPIIKAAIQHLCEDENRFETHNRLKNEIESRLGRSFRSSFLPLFNSFSENFYIEEVEDSKIIRPKTVLELCPKHCGKGRNCESNLCNKLHICKFYLLSNSCKLNKTKCNFGHDLTTAHNKKLLEENYLDGLDIQQLRNLFRNPKNRCKVTLPVVCKFYNEPNGCKKDSSDDCPQLHLCKLHVTKGCQFGRRCRNSHDILNQRVKDLLERFGVNTKRCPKDILADVRTCFAKNQEDVDSECEESKSTGKEKGGPFSKLQRMNRSRSNPCLATRMSALSLPLSAETFDIDDQDESKSVLICIYHLRGKCRYEDKCNLNHKNSMYQWQFKNTDGYWTDFLGTANTEVEEKYCDIYNSACHIKFGRQTKMHVNFDQMTARKRGTVCDIRRLSTESSAVQKFQPLATEFRWYWEDQTEKWIVYGEKNVTGYAAMLDSDSLEMNYQENPCGQMKFKTRGHDYIMDFQRMVQKNVVHKTERAVRRRPLFVDNDEIERRKKRSADTGRMKTTSRSLVVPAPLAQNPVSYIPTSWTFDRRRKDDDISGHFNLTICPPSSSETDQIKRLFFNTMPKSFTVKSVKRIENGELWMNFVSKREKMRRKRPVGNVAEVQLFHGTNEGIVDAICRQGFDFRFSGSKTGHKYGKGSYFAKMAQTADSYTDFGQKRHMFVVRVLAGDYTVGQTTFVRPPPRNPQDPFELFDSCVDNIHNPNIFVIFTFDQVYPEYLIEYHKSGK